ncbi:MAG: hypothetical protein ACI9JM_000302 [Halioglobus sp.]|jgi:hypothetical protein
MTGYYPCGEGKILQQNGAGMPGWQRLFSNKMRIGAQKGEEGRLATQIWGHALSLVLLSKLGEEYSVRP